MKLCDLNILALAKLLRNKEIRAKEILESVFERIELKEKTIHAFITITKEIALKQAEVADKRIRKGADVPLLNGIPVAIKDNICTEGIKTTCGSKILNNYIPPYNATAVEKLLCNGAVLVGKTNLDEFGMGSSTEKSAYGATRNPHNSDYVPGGSSGGSAAAVASGESVLALGTDTGGSIRMPAAYCGVVGIKPTYGSVSRYGLISYASSLDQIGAIGKNVEDCAIILKTICGYDKRDSTSANVPDTDFLSVLNQDIRDLKIGIPKEYFVEGLDLRVKENIMNAIKLLGKGGAEIIDISLPHTKYAVSAYYLLATAEASSNLARYDGVKYGYRAKTKNTDLLKMYQQTRNQGFGQEVKRRIMLGTYALSAGYYDAYYLKAQKVRSLIKNDFEKAFDKVDCIISPVTPTPPFKIGDKNEDPLQMYLEDIYTVSLNLAGLPGMSMNCGWTDGLPIGFQIIGKSYDEETVLRVGYAYERLNE